MEKKLLRIGIIGAGTIARAIIDDVQKSGLAEIGYVLTSGSIRTRSIDLPGTMWLIDQDEALAQSVDLVIEATVPEVLVRMAPSILKHSDLCGFSCTALADPELEATVRSAALKSGRRFYVPHGAVLGLDGLADGRAVFEDVTITTTKSGKSFGLDRDASGVIFDGVTRDACRRFPRNVNVHAAIALAGIGLDRTKSRIIAVPDQTSMQHRIQVSGPGLTWDINITSHSLGGVSGSYTPISAAGSVRRLIERQAIVMA